MADRNEQEEGRELLALDVGEISVVDRAANKRKFLVIKRQEGTEMGGNFEPDTVDVQKNEDGQTTTDESVEKGGSKADDVQDKKDEDVEKQVPADLKSAIQRVMTFLDKVVGGKYPYPSPQSKSEEGVEKQVPTDLKSAIDRVMTFLGKVVGGKYPYPSPKGKSEKTTKSEDNGDDGTVVKVMDDGTVVVSGVAVEKSGRKRFTSSRNEQLKDAMEKLVKLMHDLDPDSLGEIMEKAKAKEEEDEEDMKKGSKGAAKDEDVKKALAPVMKTLTELSERLGKIEDTRQPATSVGGDGKTDKVETKKGFWSNVL